MLHRGPLQLLLGDLSFGDVVKDAVPDRHAVFIGLQDCLIENPHNLALAGDHPVIKRRRIPISKGLFGLLGEGSLTILRMEEFGPKSGIRLPILGAVAENLLHLGADVAPTSVLAQLRRVDDRREALDKMAIVLTAGVDLIKKFVDLLLRPTPISRWPFHWRPYRQIQEPLDSISVQAATHAIQVCSPDAKNGAAEPVKRGGDPRQE